MATSTEDVVIEPYDPAWTKKFTEEVENLKSLLTDESNIVGFEHFGSTAVPGLDSKPIIDIMMLVRSMEEARPYIKALERIGYAYWSEDPDQERFFLVKGLPPNGPRSHHIHITEQGSNFQDRLLFRDYLREHADEAEMYEKLKYEWAEAYKYDREAYTNAKEEYVRRVTAEAKKYYSKT